MPNSRTKKRTAARSRDAAASAPDLANGHLRRAGGLQILEAPRARAPRLARPRLQHACRAARANCDAAGTRAARNRGARSESGLHGLGFARARARESQEILSRHRRAAKMRVVTLRQIHSDIVHRDRRGKRRTRRRAPSRRRAHHARARRAACGANRRLHSDPARRHEESGRRRDSLRLARHAGAHRRKNAGPHAHGIRHAIPKT